MKVKKLGDLTRPIIALAEDVERAEVYLQEHDGAYARRNYVRALFAMIEGSVYLLKQTTLTAGLSAPGRLSIAEFALLKEEAFDIDGKGEPTGQTKFIRLASNIRFTTRCLNKVFGCSLDLQAGSRAWQEFLQAIEIRNRITHPKGLEEFQVSAEEAKLANRVSEWFNDFVAAATQGISTAVSRTRGGGAGKAGEEPPPEDVSREV